MTSGVLQNLQTFWGSPLECSSIQIGDFVKGESEIIYGVYTRLFINSKVFGRRASSECYADGVKSNYMWDLCLPYTCNEDDALNIAKQIYWRSDWRPSGFNKTTPFCYATNEHTNDRAEDYRYWIVLIVLAFFVVLSIVASLVSYHLDDVRILHKAWLWKLLLCFSFHTNFTNLFTVRSARNADRLEILNMLRVVSISIVVLGHTCIMIRFFSDNVDDVRQTKTHFLMEIIYNGYFAVDTFLWLSGFLTTFVFLRMYERNPWILRSKKFWILFYVHRLVRIVPAYFCIILFKTFVLPIFLNSSVQNLGLRSTEDVCLKTWWSNLLFLNNIIGANAQCLIPAWYIATDLQIYVFSPLILVPLVLKGFVGIFIILIGIVASTVLHFFTVYSKNFPPTVVLEPSEIRESARNLDEYNRDVYYSALVRCQVYLIGMLIGFVVRKRQNIRINRYLSILIWIVALGLMACSQFGLHGWRNGDQWTRLKSALYSSLSRIGWSVGLIVITLSCRYNCGGPLQRLARLNIWIPMAKLTYCVYLIHPLVLQYMIYSTNGPIMFTGTLTMFATIFIPVWVVTWLSAVFWSCCFEMSFTNLEKMFVKMEIRTERPSYNSIETVEEVTRF
ncbi:Nose resistant to fluoxetine protein 6 [Aphelenchoides besseyi]|nr:Nose resistant to fluoxetine protein 6 [Aphelenchoides besseyi]